MVMMGDISSSSSSEVGVKAMDVCAGELLRDAREAIGAGFTAGESGVSVCAGARAGRSWEIASAEDDGSGVGKSIYLIGRTIVSSVTSASLPLQRLSISRLSF